MTGMSGKISAFSMCRKGESVFQAHSCHSQGAGGWEKLEMQWVHPLQLSQTRTPGKPAHEKAGACTLHAQRFSSRMPRIESAGFRCNGNSRNPHK